MMLGITKVVVMCSKSFSGSNGNCCRLGSMVMAALPAHISV
jgi:hypothetical protein